MSKNNEKKIEDVKANFLATMSHEMRTPMQSVYGFLELIELEETSDNVKDMVKIAKESASSLLEILDEVLEFSKMDAGKMELEDFEIPLRTLVLVVIEALSVKVKGRPIEIFDDFDEDVPAVIRGDPKRLRQILINLVGNALKFTQEGHVKIKVSAVSNDPLRLRFEVVDTGDGIDEKTCKKLFTPFNQADNSTSRKYGGTGLGLSICRKIIDLMNGDIGVISEKGVGSNFWFEIPTVEVDASTVDVDLPDLTGISVLSVEDHPMGAKEINNALTYMGASVESCKTISEANSLIDKYPYDVAVVDQSLSDGEGVNLIRNIVNTHPFMGCFMYTSCEESGLKSSLQSLGVNYLSKPASRKGLGLEVLKVANKLRAEVPSENVIKKILIADDTESIRELLKRQIDMLGVEVDIVEDGAELLSKLETEEYGLIITDLHMPNVDGYDVIESIKQKVRDGKLKKAPVVVLSADVQIAQRKVYQGHGFDECLLKPVSLGHLSRLLVRWQIIEREDSGSSEQTKDESLSTTYDAIDLNMLKQQLGALDSQAIEMLGMFVEMTTPLMEDLRGAYNDNSIPQIRELAHSLKGSARSAGAMRMGDVAFEIQESAENDKYDAKFLDQIEFEFEQVKLHVLELGSKY